MGYLLIANSIRLYYDAIFLLDFWIRLFKYYNTKTYSKEQRKIIKVKP